MSASDNVSGDAKAKRPLSPHLQVYRPQFTSALSIFHRITGVALAAGTLLLTYWLVSLAMGDQAYAAAQSFIGSFIGRLLLFGWTLAFFYHLSNGVRHLFWDAGYGFELKTAERSAVLVLIATVVLTLLSWAGGYAMI